MADLCRDCADTKCGTTDCKLYSKWTGDNCGKMIEGRRVRLCKGYTEATRPQDSSGSTEFTGCKATPAPSHIMLYHGTNHVEHFWAEEVAKARHNILKGDWGCAIYVKQ